jgi:hypothetical protein
VERLMRQAALLGMVRRRRRRTIDSAVDDHWPRDPAAMNYTPGPIDGGGPSADT